MRQHDDVEPVERTGPPEQLVGYVRVRHTHPVERVAHPTLVLRLDPRVHERYARQRDRALTRLYRAHRYGVQPERLHSGARAIFTPIYYERASGIGDAVDRERGVSHG